MDAFLIIFSEFLGQIFLRAISSNTRIIVFFFLLAHAIRFLVCREPCSQITFSIAMSEPCRTDFPGIFVWLGNYAALCLLEKLRNFRKHPHNNFKIARNEDTVRPWVKQWNHVIHGETVRVATSVSYVIFNYFMTSWNFEFSNTFFHLFLYEWAIGKGGVTSREWKESIFHNFWLIWNKKIKKYARQNL